MIAYVRTMVTCRWAARRLDRYLDADPSAPLEPWEVQRIESHVATCDRCSRVLAEYGAVSRALAGWSQARAPEAAVSRLRHFVDELIKEETP